MYTPQHPNPRQPESALLGRPPSTTILIIAIVAAIGFHVGISLFFLYLTQLNQQKIEKTIEPKILRFEEVELLALGEEKPENALPQIANPPPKPRKTDPVVINKPPKPVAPEEVSIKPPPPVKERPPQETKSDKEEGNSNEVAQPTPKNVDDNDILDALSDLHDPDRPVNDVIPEGRKDGVAGGTTSDAALANMMNTYQAKLLQELAKTWQLPTTLSRSEISALAGKVSAYVRISSSGFIISYRFVKTSKNSAFDGSIDRVLRRYTVQGGRKLPLPTDPKLKEIVVRQGLTLSDWKSIQN